MSQELSERNKKICGQLFEKIIQNVESEAILTFRIAPCEGSGDTEDLNSPGTIYEMHIFERPGELVGGARDGARFLSGFNVNLNALITLLAPSYVDIENGFEDSFRGAVVLSQGVFKKRMFDIFIHLFPPDDAASGVKVHEDGSIVLPED